MKPRPFSKFSTLNISPSNITPASVAADRPEPARQQRAADDDRGDREQLPPHALDRLAGAELRGEDHAGEPRQAAAGEHR